LGLRQSTPTNVLLAEAGIPSLIHRFQFLACKIIIKSFALQDNFLIDKLYSLQINLINNNRYNILNSFLLYKAFILQKKFRNKIATYTRPPVYCFPYEIIFYFPNVLFTSEKQAKDIKNSSYPQIFFQSVYQFHFFNTSLFFTDASKTDPSGHVGVAVYSPSLNYSKQYKIDSLASVFTGEALAISLALSSILEQRILASTVFSDSKSVLEALASPTPLKEYSHLILIIKNQLKTANLLNLTVNLIWIPAYSGILGNATADLLAKNASISGIHSPLPISHTDLYSSLKETLIHSTEDLLLKQAQWKGSQYFNLYPRFSLKPWFWDFKIDRPEIVTLTRLRANHYNLNQSLHRINIISSPACPCGHASQDIDHILWDCPLLTTHRALLLDTLQRDSNAQFTKNTHTLLQNPSIKTISSISSFLAKNNLLI